MPRTLDQKIEEQAQIIQKVNLAGRQQKIALNGKKPSDKLKIKKQKDAVENALCDQLSGKPSQVQDKKRPTTNYQDQSNKQVAELKKKMENLQPLAQAGREGTIQKKNEKTNIEASAPSTSLGNGKQAESKKGTWILSEEEKNLYGDRCPEEYQKIDLLGK